jgi:hypothetical protein
MIFPSSLILDIVDIYYASIHDRLLPVKCTAILAKRIIEEYIVRTYNDRRIQQVNIAYVEKR